ncbi:kelch-like protein [Paenibacillus sonchi]|uniref:Kelch-like protein n=1 Tax=Paenibacillus sonchi TaxID=373687 RepID=A0A974S9Y3_9BACL|nr:kelch repeat-containing protein [Paenibacillus sonchi]QQZ58948.1 kelch-like protein [Paenibacillus sonchi]
MKRRYFPVLALIVLIFGILSTQASAAGETWELQDQMPFNRPGAGVVKVDGKVYFIGGYSNGALNNVDVYDIERKVWVSKKSMPTARSIFSTEVVDGKIYVIGGSTGNPLVLNTTYTNKVEIYDPVTDTWTSGANASTSRGLTTSSTVNNKIYVFGGLNASSEGLSNVEEYDIISNTWSTKANLLTAVHGAGAVTYNDLIYVFNGGYNTSVYNKVQVYNPVTNNWTYKSSAPTSRDTIVAVNYQNKIYVIGGYDSASTGLTTVEVYDPEKDTWTAGPSLNVGRWGFGSIVFNDSLYVFGGATNTAEKLSVAPESTPTPTSSPTVTPTPTSSPTVTPTPTPSPTVAPTPTPEQPTGDRAILVVTMNTGLEKEFDLSMDEVNAFIAWYENKQSGTGKASYAIDKHDNNKGPFTNRKDYVIFDKILTFSVDEYSAK